MDDAKLPPGACDCHAHVYGPPDRNPLRPGARYVPPAQGLAEYQQMLGRIGVDRAVVVQPTVYADNRATADALAAAEGRWRGVAKFTDGRMDADIAVMDRQGFRGVRVHGTSDAREFAGLEEIANRIAPFGWHIQLHAEARHLAELESRLLRLPVPVVLDHFARVDPAEGADSPAMRIVLRLLASGSCWLKLSGYYIVSRQAFPYADLDPIAAALIGSRPDRLVWGSNWPHPSQEGTPAEAALLDLLRHWAPHAATRDDILVRNPATLYRF
jgi:predicted TIM-barrel fold metal-dependent hydrolase